MMETKPTKLTKSTPTTEKLKQGLVKRVVLLIFGFIAAVIIMEALPLLYFLFDPHSVNISTRARPMIVSDIPPISAFVLPIVTLVLLGMIAYGIYDTIRMFLRYRKSQQDDQQMFP